MKNILVPTDFSLQSLSIVHDIVNNEKGKLNIHLFHMVLVPSDMADLLYMRKAHLHAQVPESFTEAIQLLKNKYLRQVAKIDFSFYYGNSRSAVNSIIESNGIAALYLLANHQYKLLLPASVNMVPLLQKCRLTPQLGYLKGRVFTQSQAGSLSVLLGGQNSNAAYSSLPAEEVYN